jgi:hypothetical protein
MLMNRLYEPTEDEFLFHYCSTVRFHAIATSNNIRFSDINMLNDESEMRWAYSIFEEAATRLVKRQGVLADAPVIEVAFIDAIDNVFSEVPFSLHPFVACFSLNPDLLSQWRAYADDGRGFSIGFSGVSLRRQMPATFLRVLYDKEQQVKEMMAAIVAVYLAQQQASEDSKRARFIEDCGLLRMFMAAFKHPSFSEEQEVRALRVLNIERHGDLMKFLNDGGLGGDEAQVSDGPVSFQVKGNHLVAYTDVRLTPPDMSSPISQLTWGPKNHSAPPNIFLFLGGLGYTDIGHRRSVVPYR